MDVSTVPECSDFEDIKEKIKDAEEGFLVQYQISKASWCLTLFC